MIEMPNPPPELVIFEPFIETDEIVFSSKSTNENANRLLWKGDSKWVEVTVGVIGKRQSMHSLTPSVTVKEGVISYRLRKNFKVHFIHFFLWFNLFQVIKLCVSISIRMRTFLSYLWSFTRFLYLTQCTCLGCFKEKRGEMGPEYFV